MSNKKTPFAAALLLSGFSITLSLHRVHAQATTSNIVQSNVTATTAQAGKDKEAERKLRMWNWSLSQVAAHESATLFVDVPLDLTPPYMEYDKPYGVAAMKALARATKRTWKQIGGVQTFSRVDVQGPSEEVTAAFAWLNSLSQEQFTELVNGTMTIGQAEEKQQELLQSLYGWEPDLNFAMLGNAKPTQLRLALDPAVQYRDPRTGVIRKLSVDYRPQRASVAKVATAAKQTEPMQALDTPETGKLDFGKGATLPLADIVEKAQKAFDVRYVVDGRVANGCYFVSGRYSQKRFEQALDRVTTVPPVHLMQAAKPNRRSDVAFLRERFKGEAGQKLDITWLRDRMGLRGSDDINLLNQKYGAKEELSADDFLQGKTIRCGDLCQGKPGLTAFFETNGLKPDVMLTLSADFVLALQSAGMHPLSHGSGEIDGQTVPVVSPNETMIGLQ